MRMRLILLLLPLAMLTINAGCFTKHRHLPSTDNRQAVDHKQDRYKFSNHDFVITLPGDYDRKQAENGLVTPLVPDSFPTFSYYTQDPIEDNSAAGLIDHELTVMRKYCQYTDGCARILYSQVASLGQYEAAKIVKKLQGRTDPGSEGFVQTYSYLLHIPKQNYTYRFYTSADDTRDLEKIEFKFDEIMKTIELH